MKQKVTIETLLYKLRSSNNLIATLLAYGFGYTMLGHILGCATAIVMIQAGYRYYQDVN